MYASFHRVRELGYMTVSEMLGTMQENDLFNIFREFSKVVHIIAVISVTSGCSAERSFSALPRIKTYLRSTMGQQRVSNIALINIEKPYANSVVNNDMGRVIDIFGRRNGRESYFFYVLKCFLGSYDRFIPKKYFLFICRPSYDPRFLSTVS